MTEAFSVKQRLTFFHEVTAHQVSHEAAAAMDRPNLGDPQQVAEHASKINTALLNSEKDFLP